MQTITKTPIVIFDLEAVCDAMIDGLKHNGNGGHTYWHQTKPMRYVVGVYSLPPVPMKEAVETMASMVLEASQMCFSCGSWYNPEDDLVYIDRVMGFDSLSDALNCARENNQLAIYDTEDFESIYL
jgi:hypothetical protein